MKMKVSVIILNWNGVEHGFLRRYLPSVVRHSVLEGTEVVVADNGSTDSSLDVIREEFPSVRVIALDQNYGFAEGYNRAIAQTESQYVVLLNDDVEVTPGWLEPLIAHMESHPKTAALQPKILADADHTRFEYAGAAGGYLDRHGYPYCRGRIFDTVEADHGQYDTACPVMWASGACLFVRRDLYLLAGGLDARFFAHMEEIDLCWRLRRMGMELYCIPTSVVYHLGGGSLPQGNPKKTRLNFRNSLLMLYKNLPPRHRCRMLFVRRCLDAVAALNYIAHGQLDQARAIRDAHHEASQMIRDFYRPEEQKQAAGIQGIADGMQPLSAEAQGETASETQSKTANVQPLFGEAKPCAEERHNILVAYYLRGKKKYSDLK